MTVYNDTTQRERTYYDGSLWSIHIEYVGIAIVAFFITNSGDLYLSCINAVNCAYAMIRVTQEGINPLF
jgi:hypothetical protein